MSNSKKENLLWWALMVFLLGLVLVLQYRDTPNWTEAIKPGLVIVAFGFLLKTFADIYNLIFARRRLNVWSFVAFSVAIICLLLLWTLDRNIKALVFVVGLTLSAFVIVLVARWLFNGRG